MDEHAGEQNSKRIKRLRLALGEKQATFARHFGVDQSTISKWERGTQTPDSKFMEIVASLEIGDDPMDPTTPTNGVANPLFTVVPVAGYVGAGAKVFLFADGAPSSGDFIKTPKGFGAVQALIVRGDSMYPAYKDGDIIFYSGAQAELPIRVGGDDYVVFLKDGSVLLKVVEPNGDGTYTLNSYNAPPVRSAEIESAFPVRYIEKNRRARRRTA